MAYRDATVDVVIPAYNCEKYVLQAVRSVLDQTYPIHNVIVVDDGSSDATLATLNTLNDPRLKIVVHPRNMGESAARNTGLRCSTADLVAFLDSDDLWAPQKIEKQVETIYSSDLRPSVVYSAYTCVDSRGELCSSIVTEPTLRGWVLRDLLRANLISGSASSVLMKRECAEDIGQFNVSQTYGSDWDYWLRVSEKYSFDFVAEPLVQIRVHSNQIQSQLSKEKMMNFLVQELQIIHRWAHKETIPYIQYLKYVNSHYMLSPGLSSPLKIYRSLSAVSRLIPNYDGRLIASYFIIFGLRLRHRIRRLLGVFGSSIAMASRQKPVA